MNEISPGEWICPNCGSINRPQDHTQAACANCGRVAGTTVHVSPAGQAPKAKATGLNRAMEILGASLILVLKIVGGAFLVLVGVVVLMLAVAFASCAFGR